MNHKHYIDLTMDLNCAFNKFNPKAIAHFSPKLLGHVGTHIDIMNTPGPNLNRFVSRAYLIDVSGIFDRDITIEDSKLEQFSIEPGDSIIFKTNWSDQMFETEHYFKNHPCLSYKLIEYLLHKKINFIAIDAPGVRRGKEHHAIDEHCANKDVFIVENLVNLNHIDSCAELVLYCFPLKFSQNTGVTCRVVVAY